MNMNVGCSYQDSGTPSLPSTARRTPPALPQADFGAGRRGRRAAASLAGREQAEHRQVLGKRADAALAEQAEVRCPGVLIGGDAHGGPSLEGLVETALAALQLRDRLLQGEPLEVLRLGVCLVGRLVVIDLEQAEQPWYRGIGVGLVEAAPGLGPGQRPELADD